MSTLYSKGFLEDRQVSKQSEHTGKKEMWFSPLSCRRSLSIFC
jgi:hypothetical protein